MKRVYLLLAAIFIIGIFTANAQIKIAVQDGTNATFYADLVTALNAAPANSSVYIPGGTYTISNYNLNKPLKIYGAGHYPSFTTATGRTQIDNLTLVTGADGSSITGIYFNGGLYFGNGPSDQMVNDVRIERCWIGICYLGKAYPNTSTNRIVRENMIYNLYGFISNCTIDNNIIMNCQWFDGCTFSHNNFFSFNGWGIGVYNDNNCLFMNNILYMVQGPAFMGSSNENFFVNNLFNWDPGFPLGTNNGDNNLVNIPNPSIFTTWAGWVFDYNDNYHLAAGSPGINYGTDGTDVGIYGSVFPYKDGAIPVNPHITTSTIGPTVITGGTLNVDIQVNAQTR